MPRRATHSVIAAVLLSFLARYHADAFSVSHQATNDLTNCWQDLASDDAGRAYRAICVMVQQPAAGVRMRGERLAPAPPADVEQIQRWIGELSDPKFAIRDKAF